MLDTTSREKPYPGGDELVRDYFSRLRAIHSGDRGAVEKMLELWDEDGTCTFVGTPPLNGQFRGYVPLATLFKSMSTTAGMKVRADDRETVTMNQPQFTIDRMKTRGNKVITEWTTKITTAEGKSFSVAGSNTFTFKDGKIADLLIVTSPRPGEAHGFAIDDLTQLDIGRLALAAWAVV